MRKTWVKRENIYYVPFYKQKSKIFLLLIFLLGIIFIIYQAFYINQLPKLTTSTVFEHEQQPQKLHNMDIYDGGGGGGGGGEINSDVLKIIRGIRLFHYDSYKPNIENKFRCLDGSREIPFEYLNDDYCDCILDGSDEPSTNACSRGRFYCKYQKRHITGRGQDVFVSSTRINDGICDCCDGSDEWLTKVVCPKTCDM